MAKVLSDDLENIDEIDPLSLSETEFRKLSLEAKSTLLDNLVLDSIFRSIRSRMPEIEQLIKYRQHITKKISVAKNNKRNKSKRLFINDQPDSSDLDTE